jgi:dTDP-4-dehydrorhamnose reductase
MKVLITGAAGMLGLDLSAGAAAAGHDVTALARAELDITDRSAIDAAVSRARPDVVINCAAWTDVDGAEGAGADSAAVVNGAGAGNLARAAGAAGAWTIHVSSDYVFDGSKRTPYVESDAVGPVSSYGRSKLAGEEAVAAAAPAAHTTVRSSWLFGAGGPCFPKTILRLAAEREQLPVVDDQFGCPTFTGDLTRALLELAEHPVDGVVHVAGSGDCSWYGFASEIVAAAGLECEVTPCTTAEFAVLSPRPAARPAYSVLRTERGAAVPVLPEWRDGLRSFMSTAVRSA